MFDTRVDRNKLTHNKRHEKGSNVLTASVPTPLQVYRNSQGSSLGSQLFILLINDLPNIFDF